MDPQFISDNKEQEYPPCPLVTHTRSKRETNSGGPLIQNSLCPMNIAVESSLIKHKQSKHEKTWDDLWHIVDAGPPTGSLFNQRPEFLVVLGCKTEITLCSRIVLKPRIQISERPQFPERTYAVSWNMSKVNSHPCDLQGLSVWASKSSREIPWGEQGLYDWFMI